MSKIIQAFEKEVNLTEKGLKELTETKKNLVIDVSTKSGMTLARKERTERNKYIEHIKRISIDTETLIKDKRAALIDEVTVIYAPIIDAFDAEALRLKQEVERLAQIEEKRVDDIRLEINEIKNFGLKLHGKSSEELSGIIEAVDMIDIEESFAEFTQEAMQVKKETLSELNIVLAGAIQSEKLSADRIKLKEEQDKQAALNRINELKAKALERLTELMMLPSTMADKTADEINKQQNYLDLNELKEEDFGELFNQANTTKLQVVRQLDDMYDDAKKSEAKEAPVETQPIIEQEKAEELVKQKIHGGYKTKVTLSPHEEMMDRVKVLADDHGVTGTPFYSCLENILNQYNPN